MNRRAVTSGAPEAVRREARIAAPAEVVFAFLTDAAKRARWAGAQADSDPRPGGAHRIVINAGHIVSGEYVEVRPNHRLVYTWGWVDSAQMPPGSSIVEVDLAAEDGGTLLSVVHSGLPENACGGHGEVWDHYLPRLAVAAAGRDPGPDPWAAETTES
ncbi:MAG TPA: SRPBCC domain-containing protein [bacterium]|nr:SRPBCC domain-containing protein [bacterium]